MPELWATTEMTLFSVVLVAFGCGWKFGVSQQYIVVKPVWCQIDYRDVKQKTSGVETSGVGVKFSQGIDSSKAESILTPAPDSIPDAPAFLTQ